MSLWDSLKDEKNQKVLAMIGAVVAALATAGWQIYGHFNPPAPSSPPAASAPQAAASLLPPAPTGTAPGQKVDIGQIGGNATVDIRQEQHP